MSYRTDFVENLKAFRSRERAEFEDTIEREEQEKTDAPVREAEAKLQATAKELGFLMRQTVVTGPDPEFRVPESLPRSMKKADAFPYSCSEAEKLFALEEFKAYHTQENWDIIAEYLDRNGITKFANFDCYKQAFDRLLSLGLLSAKAADSVPAATPVPEAQPVVEEQPQTFQKPKYAGVDGREYTEREVYLMSSEELKSVFGLYGPNLPSIEKALAGQ